MSNIHDLIVRVIEEDDQRDDIECCLSVSANVEGKYFYSCTYFKTPTDLERGIQHIIEELLRVENT